MSGALDPEVVFWRRESLRHAVEALVAASGHSLGASTLADVPVGNELEMLGWIVEAPRALGLEGALRRVDKDDLLTALIAPGAHAIPVVTREGGRMMLKFAMIVSEGFRCRVICSSGTDLRCSTIDLCDLITAAVAGDASRLEPVFDRIPGGRDVLARITSRERLDRLPMNVISFRPDAASPLSAVARNEGAGAHVAAFVTSTVIQLAVTGIAAFTLGSSALDGLVDRGRVAAWIMISVVAIPFTYIASLRLSLLAMNVGAAIKRRTLEGAFFLDEDVLRREGYSAQIARVNEASLLERLSVADAFAILSPLAMMGVAFYLFVTTSRHPVVLASAAAAILVIAAFLIARIIDLQINAYRQRTNLTGDIVDKLVGHRTRAVQQNPSMWHRSEDRLLFEYMATLGRLDRLSALVGSLPRIWILGAAAIMIGFFVAEGNSDDVVLSAIAVVLMSVALGALAAVTERVTMMVTAWQAVKPLFLAGRQRTRPERPVHTVEEQNEWPTVLAASSLTFAYGTAARPVFTDATVRVRKGERLLIEGPSGGGKTTFAKIVAGELRPQGGSVLVCGLDPFTGSETQWRKLVASVPQFHENHVFSQTFAFNVDPVSGRHHLTREAEEICEELELGPLLRRMPAGSTQLLGETGWQLSHGERSRLFIARALLQKAQLVILDESFAALDPVTMRTVVDCVRRRAGTLMVIAHV